MKLQFVKIPDRSFLNLRATPGATVGGLDLGGTLDHPEVIAGALVRVTYKCTEEEAKLIDEGAVRRALIAAGARKVFIKATVERTSRARVAEVAEGLDTSAAFEMWLATQSIPESDVQALRDLHAGYSEASRG